MDAYQAGVRHLVLVISRQISQAVSEQFLPLLPRDLEVSMVLQRQDELPVGCTAEPRKKPWGTGHALWCARNVVPAGCVVINADDYYGSDAMGQLLEHFENSNDWAMHAYQLENTLSDHGAVNRGLCEVKDGLLVAVRECLSIKRVNGEIQGEVDNRLVRLDPGTPVSMNIWGFGPDIFSCLEKGLTAFFSGVPDKGPTEFYLPSLVMESISAGDKRVRFYQGRHNWHGITYREDLESLAEVFQERVYE